MLSPPSPRWLGPDGAATHHDRDHSLDRARLAFDVPRPDSDVIPTSLRAPIPPSPTESMDPEDRSAKHDQHRAELARRLETLQSTRSALSSPDPTVIPGSRPEANNSGRRGTNSETAIRDLEAEIAHLRAALTAMNARHLADEFRGDSRSEPLPAYAE